MAEDLNSVSMTGNLTRDPELKALASGTSVCNLRLASNTRRKSAGGEWEDKRNFFDVTVWGGQGEQCARFLSKGSPVAVQGRLDWREWEAQDGSRRQTVDIVADTVKFLPSGDRPAAAAPVPTPTSDVPVDVTDFQPPLPSATPAGGADDDIPF